MKTTKESRAKKLVRQIGSPFEIKPNKTHLETNVIRYMTTFAGEENTRAEVLLKKAQVRLQYWMNKYGAYRDPDRDIINEIDSLL